MKIGDVVKVINDGRAYSKYENMAEQAGLTKWCVGYAPVDGDIGRIIGIYKHTFPMFKDELRDEDKVVAVYSKQRDIEFLINIQGLEVVHSHHFEEGLFEL